MPLQTRAWFINLIGRPGFVITDGGSMQEECASMGKPCLVVCSEASDARDSTLSMVQLRLEQSGTHPCCLRQPEDGRPHPEPEVIRAGPRRYGGPFPRLRASKASDCRRLSGPRSSTSQELAALSGQDYQSLIRKSSCALHAPGGEPQVPADCRSQVSHAEILQKRRKFFLNRESCWRRRRSSGTTGV
jgi:hypothetical protein